MKKVILGLIAVIVIIAVITNPKLEQHSRKITNEYVKFYKEIYSKDEAQLNHFTNGIGREMTEKQLLSDIEFHNYVFFSTSNINEHELSIGLFGKNFIRSDKKEIIKNDKRRNEEKNQKPKKKKKATTSNIKINVDKNRG